MVNSFRLICLNTLIIIGFSCIAQETMTLQQALSFGLENNFPVKIARNESTMAQNNTILGTGGFLPSAALNSSITQNRNSTRQERYDGTITEKENAKTTTTNANAQLNWVLFDGLKMFAENSRYQQLSALGQNELQATMESSVAQIITNYYALVQESKSLSVLHQAFTYSVMRRDLAYHRFKIGVASETDFLQASVDVNADSAAWINQQYVARSSCADLCRAMGKPYNSSIIPADTTIETSSYTFDQLIESALGNNTDLHATELQKRLAEINLRTAHSPMYPKLSFTATYAYNLMEAEVGILRTNRTYGPSAGFTLSYGLFNGFTARTNAKNAKLQLESAEWEQQDAMEQLKSDLLKLYNEYQNQQTQARVAVGNIALARRNTTLAWQRYKLGEITDLDFRQIQYLQTETENRLLISQYKAKQIETELLRLCGLLITK